jgi:hypothetical protein
MVVDLGRSRNLTVEMLVLPLGLFSQMHELGFHGLGKTVDRWRQDQMKIFSATKQVSSPKGI